MKQQLYEAIVNNGSCTTMEAVFYAGLDGQLDNKQAETLLEELEEDGFITIGSDEENRRCIVTNHIAWIWSEGGYSDD